MALVAAFHGSGREGWYLDPEIDKGVWNLLEAFGDIDRVDLSTADLDVYDRITSDGRWDISDELDSAALYVALRTWLHTERADIHDLIIAVSASTDSAINQSVFPGIQYAATADFGLTRHIADMADKMGLSYHAGPIVSGDAFYRPMEGFLDILADHGALGVEMEAAALFRIAAGFKARAAAILSVSDHLITGEDLPR